MLLNVENSVHVIMPVQIPFKGREDITWAEGLNVQATLETIQIFPLQIRLLNQLRNVNFKTHAALSQIHTQTLPQALVQPRSFSSQRP